MASWFRNSREQLFKDRHVIIPRIDIIHYTHKSLEDSRYVTEGSLCLTIYYTADYRNHVVAVSNCKAARLKDHDT
jgi:hypothetical protein